MGFIISIEGIAIDLAKIQVVKDWQVLSTVKDIQSFLSFCNFCRKFVPKYSRVAKPLTRLTYVGQPFEWSPECKAAFEELKSLLLIAPILCHYEYSLDTQMETDTSDGVVAGVLL